MGQGAAAAVLHQGGAAVKAQLGGGGDPGGHLVGGDGHAGQLDGGVCTPDRSTTYCTASCPSHFTVMWVLGAVEEALRKNTAYLPWPMEESS